MRQTKSRMVAVVACGSIALGGLMALSASPAQAAVGCDVQYQGNDWPGGFTANLVIKNTGDALSSWTLSFDVASTTKLSNGWSATWSQSGNTVQATNVAWNGNLANGASTTVGFQGSWSGSNPAPTSFKINGVTCGGGGQQTTTTTSTTSRSTTSTTTTTRPTTTTTTTRPTTTTTTTTSQSSGQFYVDPNTAAARWVAANSGDSRAGVIRDRIASQSLGHWEAYYNSSNPSAVAGTTAEYINAANSAGKIPVLVVYALPNRDCGGASAGGAPNLSAYGSWVSSLASGLGSRPVYVILEPDALALQTCLSSSEATARGQAIASAVNTIKNANRSAKVYLDAGHSAWNSASVTAQRLQGAGISAADGFFTNVSNFNSTQNEVNFGQQVINILGGGKKQIIDTSRNGNGTGGSTDWCDDNVTVHRIGTAPTTNTGVSTVDAFIWVKPPGELDGCGGTAGSFVPQKAYQLAGGGTVTSTTTTTTTTTRPTTTTTTSRATTTTHDAWHHHDVDDQRWRFAPGACGQPVLGCVGVCEPGVGGEGVGGVGWQQDRQPADGDLAGPDRGDRGHAELAVQRCDGGPGPPGRGPGQWRGLHPVRDLRPAGS